LAVLGVAAMALAGCGSSPARVSSAGRTVTTRSPVATVATTEPTPVPGTTTIATTTTTEAAASHPTTTAAPPTTAPSTTAAAPAPSSSAPVPELDLVGSAGQAIVVTASGYGVTTATFTAYRRSADGWQPVFGPWTAHVGYNGLAPPGEKVEGDGRTPSGVYGFGFFFGVQPDPGVRFPYRPVTSRSIVWDDDPSSPLYNQWVDSDQQDPGADPEAMYQPGAYAYGAVIAYNTARTPGLGSAIFLHVSTGGSTAGCVSLPSSQLLDVLRWLDPAQAPRIVMAVG
jgi:L,D-peptidoglycan transpeptidase YkuD (ErfK/YbiS/YcfS/YnhG family)